MLKSYEWRSESLRKCAVVEFLKNQNRNKKCVVVESSKNQNRNKKCAVVEFLEDQNCNRKCVVVEFSKNQNRNKKCVVVKSLKDQKSLLYMKSFRSKIFIKFVVDKHSKCRRWTKNYNYHH